MAQEVCRMLEERFRYVMGRWRLRLELEAAQSGVAAVEGAIAAPRPEKPTPRSFYGK